MAFTVFQSLLLLLWEARAPLGYSIVVLGGVVAILAIVSPARFIQLCKVSNTRFNTPLRTPVLDQYIVDPEKLAWQYPRLTGVLMLSLAMMLSFAVLRSQQL